MILFLLQLLVQKLLVNKWVAGHHQLQVVLVHQLVQEARTSMLEETQLNGGLLPNGKKVFLDEKKTFKF